MAGESIAQFALGRFGDGQGRSISLRGCLVGNKQMKQMTAYALDPVLQILPKGKCDAHDVASLFCNRQTFDWRNQRLLHHAIAQVVDLTHEHCANCITGHGDMDT